MTSRLQYLSFVICITVVTVVTSSQPIVKAIGSKQFAPPTNIKLEMYALTDTGAIDFLRYPDPRCSPTGDTSEAYGCTWYYNIDGQDGERIEPYPFDSYEIEIGYEGELKNGFQQGYLHNVTPHEVAITGTSQGNKPLSCVKAQAIASRTFAYNQTYQAATPTEPLRINNSNQKQVYIPYLYDGLTPSQQQRVNSALNEALYMTLPGDTFPIRAHFGADNDATTATGSTSYLKSIYDPISHLGTDFGTDNGGMSSKGC